MQNCLLIDFGSTYTKLTAVDLTHEVILGTAKSQTTIQSTIMDGFYTAKKELLAHIGRPNITFDEHYACSSARGGFKMVAIGLSPTLTTEAAKRAALGAGTRILKVYSYGLKKQDVDEINELDPDIILLCGGTDGGNKNGIIRDATLLASTSLDIPIVVAGNTQANPDIQALLTEGNKTFYITENVMPQINVLNAHPTRRLLRDIFMKKIVEAKGMETVEKEIGQILMPTPTAVLHAADLLARGTENEPGWDSVIVVDIGGATTDIHSIGDGKPTHPDIRLEGLQEPTEKRTVEGDLGMRYSALSLFESAGKSEFARYLEDSSLDSQQECLKRATHPDMVSLTMKDKQFDDAMAKIAVQKAVERHAGSYRLEPTPSRVITYQTGKDLSHFNAIVGTGGILVHSEASKDILDASRRMGHESYLKPISPNLYLDTSYILSAMGLLSDYHPDIALRLLKANLSHLE